jgi:hypothetical protein
MDILLTLNSGLGADLGPNFTLATNNGGTITPNTATKTELLAGKSVSVSDASTIVFVQSVGVCTTQLSINIAGITTSTTSTTTAAITSTTTSTSTTSTSTSTTSTSTTLAPIPVTLAYSNVDGPTACYKFTAPIPDTATYYLQPGGTLADGNTLYVDGVYTNIVADGFYSNGVDLWEVNIAASGGVLSNGTPCPQTTTTTTSTSTTSTSTSTTSTSTTSTSTSTTTAAPTSTSTTAAPTSTSTTSTTTQPGDTTTTTTSTTAAPTSTTTSTSSTTSTTTQPGDTTTTTTSTTAAPTSTTTTTTSTTAAPTTTTTTTEPPTTTSTSTSTSTSTTTTTNAYYSFGLGVDSISGNGACIDYASAPITYYAATPLSNGVILYQDSALSTLVPDNYYSNGINSWLVTGGNGTLTSEALCSGTPTTSTTSTTSTTTSGGGGTTTSTSSTTTTTVAPTSSDVFISVQPSLDITITDVTVDGVSVTLSTSSYPIVLGVNENVSGTINKVGTYTVVVYFGCGIGGQRIGVTDSNATFSCQNAGVGTGQSLTFTGQYLDGVTSPALTVEGLDGTC